MKYLLLGILNISYLFVHSNSLQKVIYAVNHVLLDCDISSIINWSSNRHHRVS